MVLPSWGGVRTRSRQSSTRLACPLRISWPGLRSWSKIFGGLAVLLGAFVVLVSLPMAAILLVAMFTVHLPYGFSSITLKAVTAAGAQFGQPGYETDLLYLALLASLVISGSGPLSIDGFIRRKFGNE